MMEYIPTGFTQIDNALGGGLHRSELTVLTSTDTAMGKTSFATSILRHNLLEQNTSAILFTLESSVKDVMMKLVSMESGVDGQVIRRGATSEHEHQKIKFTFRRFEDEHRFWVAERIYKSVDEIRTLMVGKDVDLVVVDYVELMRLADDNYAQVLVDLRRVPKDILQSGREHWLALLSSGDRERIERLDERREHWRAICEKANLVQHELMR